MPVVGPLVRDTWSREAPGVNRHLNVFTKYERTDHHEDQLTRAAMIVLRLVPAAREALLRLIEAPGLAQLPGPGEVDMQTGDVLGHGAEQEIGELVSVFLVPDERRAPEPSGPVEASDRGQRLDGVIRFAPELIVVVESKVVEGAENWQARRIDFGRGQPQRTRTVDLRWHDLLEAWWKLGDHGLLAPAEELLVQDLMDFADQHFAWLMPFTTVRRAAGDQGRINRRLRAIVLSASGVPPRDRSQYLMLDELLGTTSVQRAELAVVTRDGAPEMWLEMWAGESIPQAKHLYAEGRAGHLVDLDADEEWEVTPNVHLSFRHAHWRQRLYLDAWSLPINEYVGRWTDGGMDWVAQYDVEVLRAEVWPWLLEQGLAQPSEDDELDAFIDRLGRRKAYLRPGIAIRRTWPLAEAEQLDDDGALVGQVRESINAVLACLDEPLLAPAGTAPQAI